MTDHGNAEIRLRWSAVGTFWASFLEPFKGLAAGREKPVRILRPDDISGVAGDWRRVGDDMRAAMQIEEHRRKAS